MEKGLNLEAFVQPGSVAVIGATERPGSWGSFISLGLTSQAFSGPIYAVNPGAEQVFGLPVYPDIRDIEGPVDLAVLTIPDNAVETAVRACGEKGVKGITIITAGYGETSRQGQTRQDALVALARSYGMRILGPNVSGTFNLHHGFNASSVPGQDLLATPVAAICQGGYAFYDMLSAGGEMGYGVGWFMHTGNEADLTITDFLDSFGVNDQVKAIVMYIEAVRDGRRFLEVAGRVGRRKPVLVYKAGRAQDAARAARSHTGALAGNQAIYQGLFKQTGLLMCPAMELLLPVSHALVERPPMKGTRVGIVTVGGSWGVSLTDALEDAGLQVPQFSPELQQKLHDQGMPERASTRNPVDFGASGLFLSVETPIELARAIAASGEVDALIVHGLGRPGMHDEHTLDEWRFFLDIEKEQIRGIAALEKAFGRPILIASHCNPWQSQAVSDLTGEGYRIYNRLGEIAQLLALLREYWRRR